MTNHTRAIAAYYLIERCIASCLTLEQLDTCERMISTYCGILAGDRLATLALIRRCELIATIYPIHEK